MIESLVSKGNMMTYNSFMANTNAKKNMSASSSGTVGVSENPSTTLPISLAPPIHQQSSMPLNFLP